MKKEWSVRDLAELCCVSKPTVQAAINELELEYDEFKKNKQIFYPTKARKIAEHIKNDLDFDEIFACDDNDGNLRKERNDNEIVNSENIEKSSQKVEKQSQSIDNKLEELEKKLEELAKSQQSEIEFLRKQIETKDLQIQDQTDQIKNLTAKNDTLLAANLKLSKQLEIEEKKQNEDIIEPQKKHSIFNIFRSKK